MQKSLFVLLQVQMERRLVVEGVVLDERTSKPIDVYGIQARRIGGDANGGGDFFGRGGRGADRGGSGTNRGNRGNADAGNAAPTADELARQQERDNRNAEREAHGKKRGQWRDTALESYPMRMRKPPARDTE